MRLAIARIAVLVALAASLVGKDLVGQDDVAALRASAAARPDRAEVFYNLAVAEWRAGDLAAAESAIEKYAALAVPPRPDLHRGMLGAIRYAAAERLSAGESPDLQAAKKEAEAALDHFVKGALVASSPELQRNTERTLRLLDELRKRIEEQQQQQSQEESKSDGEPSKDDRQKSDDKQQGDQGQTAESKDPEQQQQQQNRQPNQAESDPSSEPSSASEPKGSQSSESNAADPARPEPQPQQGQPQAGQPPDGEPTEGQPQQSPQQQGQSESPAGADGKPRQDAPGEGTQPLRLTPEQAKRLMDQLQKLDAQLQTLQARSASRRAKVEKDW